MFENLIVKIFEMVLILLSHFLDFISLLLEKGEEGERHKNIIVREKYRSVAPHSTLLQTEPTPQARALKAHHTTELFHLQDDTQPTEPHWSGLLCQFLMQNFLPLMQWKGETYTVTVKINYGFL